MSAASPSRLRREGPGRLLLKSVVALPVAIALALVLPAPSGAGGPGKWTSLSGPTGTSLTQVSLTTTPDNLLHVAWIGDSATAGATDLLHRTVGSSGAFGARHVAETAWSTLNDPAIVYDPVGARLGIVVSGIRNAYPGDPYQGMVVTTSANGGANWTLTPGLLDPPGTQAWASPVSVIGAGNVLYETWYGASGVWVHRGTSPATPAYDFHSGLGAFGYHSAFGLDKAGPLWVVWASNATGHSGLYAQMVDQATGAPGGTRYKLPGSTTKWSGAQRFSMMMSRVPVTGRTKGSGVFVAYPAGYPSTRSVKVWKITAAKRTSQVVAAGGAAKDETAVAAGPDGRVWVVWSERAAGRGKVVVRRSNAAVTKWGPVRSYRLPSGYRTVWHLAAAVRNGKLDVLVHAGGGSKADATLHIQYKAPT